MAKKVKKETAKELIVKLKHKYGDDGYIVLEQVSRGVGAASYEGYIDAVVLSIWPSRGLTRSAFEVKVDRKDYLNEIRLTKKNEWAKEMFHTFWYIAPKGVIKSADEIPEGCGWMKPYGKTLTIVKQAKLKSEPELDDYLMYSLMRNIKKASMQNAEEFVSNFRMSDEFKDILNVQVILIKWMHEHGIYWHGDVKNLEEYLNKVTVDKKNEKDRNQLMKVLDLFQRRVIDLFEIFATVAHLSLLERDKAGSFVVDTWGGLDAKALSGLLKKKHRKSDRYQRKEDKRVIELLKLIHEIVD